MKQIIQDLKKGDTILEEVPVPRVKSGSVLIQTTRTLVSLGTERMLVDFGKANFLQKAKQYCTSCPGSTPPRFKYSHFTNGYGVYGGWQIRP